MTNEPQAEVPRPAELTLDEPFHRIKRTVMLLSGGLILLGCTDPSVAAAALVTVPGLPGSAVPSNAVLRLTLWLAAAYYAWGLTHLVIAAHRSNRDLLDPGQLANYEIQLKGFIEGFGERAAVLEQQVSTVESDWSDLIARIEPELRKDNTGEEFRARGEFGFDERHLGWSSRTKDPAERVSMEQQRWERGQASVEQFQLQRIQLIPQIGARVDELAGVWRQNVEMIRAMSASALKAAERITLNKGIYRDRRVQFYMWEVAAPGVIFAAATLATFTPIGFRLAHGVDGLARAWAW